MKEEMVSVIIPTYNRANTIERAIRSVLAQTYAGFELIIVDDGSTDDTEKVLASIEDERVRYIPLKENRGPAAARNEGVRQSRYDYIAFHDSDDLWKADKLEKQMNALCESQRADMAYCSYETDEGTVFPREWVPREQRQGWIFPYLLRGNMIGTPTMLIKKECFWAVGGFKEELRCMEDYEFVLRFAHEYPIAYVDEHLLYVYTSKGSVNYNLGHYISAEVYIIDKWKRELLRYGLLEASIDNLLNRSAECGKEAEVAQALQKILDFEVGEDDAFAALEDMLRRGEYQNIINILQKEIKDVSYSNNDYAILFLMAKFSQQEEKSSIRAILEDCATIGQVREKYYKIRYAIRRMEYNKFYNMQEREECFVFLRSLSDIVLKGMLDYTSNDSEKLYGMIRGKEEASFCFIVCVDNEMAYDEMKRYIDCLDTEPGWKVNICPVYGAKSIFQAYNQAMRKETARYKIYLHQDIFILNKNFLFEIKKIFEEHSEIGMLGVAGCEKMSANGVWWNGEGIHKECLQSNPLMRPNISKEISSGEYVEVEALDGTLLITQYDLPWREDIFEGWHFYDISQSYEFRKKGYKIAVAGQDMPWCMHDGELGFDTKTYDKNRAIFLQNYTQK